jgi:hypothetical protein
MKENPYSMPEENLSPADEQQYDIKNIKIYRVVMIAALIATGISNTLFQLQPVKGAGLYESLLGFGALTLIISATILASKTFRKVRFAVLR